MNIFFLMWNPQKCAEMYGDAHVIKIILEICQMLSTCYRWLHGERPKKLQGNEYQPNTVWIQTCTQWLVENYPDKHYAGLTPYKMTHYNHGTNVWLREYLGNFMWAVQHALALCTEKTVRWPKNKPHRCEPLLQWFKNNPPVATKFVTTTLPDKYNITVPYMAISDDWNCKLTTEEESDPYVRVQKSYRKYYQAKFERHVFKYSAKPDRQPDFIKNS